MARAEVERLGIPEIGTPEAKVAIFRNALQKLSILTRILFAAKLWWL